MLHATTSFKSKDCPVFPATLAGQPSHRSTAKAMIDPEALPDPEVVASLEVNKLLAAPPHLGSLVVEKEVSTPFMWGVTTSGKRCAVFAVWLRGFALDAGMAGCGLSGLSDGRLRDQSHRGTTFRHRVTIDVSEMMLI